MKACRSLAASNSNESMESILQSQKHRLCNVCNNHYARFKWAPCMSPPMNSLLKLMIWNSRATGTADLKLSFLLTYSQAHFKDLVTCRPELIESYESVDGNGASVRRYMLNDPDSHIEVANQNHVQIGEDTGRSSIKEDQELASIDGNPQLHPLMEGNRHIEAEVIYLKRRFRSAFIPASPSSQSKGEQFLSNKFSKIV